MPHDGNDPMIRQIDHVKLSPAGTPGLHTKTAAGPGPDAEQTAIAFRAFNHQTAVPSGNKNRLS